MTFADKLQSLRKAKGLSQEELAENCGVTRQSVSKWENRLGYPETEKLLLLCNISEVNLDYLLRDISDTLNRTPKSEQPSPYAPYIGKWLQVFLKDKEFNGFYCVGLVAIQNSKLFFVDDKGKAILVEDASISAISDFTGKRQTKKLFPIPDSESILDDISNYFSGKKCNVTLKQEHPLLGFNKPGGFYSILVESISDSAVTAQDVNGGKHTVKMSDILFIKECD